MKRFSALYLVLAIALSIAGCAKNDGFSHNGVEYCNPKANNAQTTTPLFTDGLRDEAAVREKTGFVGANIGMGGLMAGDGEWIYYRDETDWGLYKAKTDGSEKTLLLPVEEYSPSNLNVLDEWVYFSNYRDDFSLYRVRTDGTAPEKLVGGYCSTLFVAESGIYFDCRDESNRFRAFRINLDGTDQELIAEDFSPVSYYNGILYLYNFRSETLSAYNTETNETTILNDSIKQAAYFSTDESGIYYWENLSDFCYLDPATGSVTVLRKGPIGDYYNYANGRVYFVAYGGSNYDYSCCYSLELSTKIETPILSLSEEMYDFNGEPIGLTQAEYLAGDYNPEVIPKDTSGWPVVLNERAFEIYLANGQVFSRGVLKESMPAHCWICCNGKNGQLWG